MEPVAGSLLVATPSLADPNFWRSVILLIHANADGHVGLILNRPTLENVVDHLEGWGPVVSGEGKVHFGGPVEPEVAISLVASDRGDSTGLHLVSVADITSPPDHTTTARIFAGYAGWGPGQLDMEIGEGAWVVVDADPRDPFDDPAGQWERILQRQGGRLAMMATFPIDPTLN